MSDISFEPRTSFVLSLITDSGLLPNDFKVTPLYSVGSELELNFRIRSEYFPNKTLDYQSFTHSICLVTDLKKQTQISFPKNEAILESGEFQESFIKYLRFMIKDWLES